MSLFQEYLKKDLRCISYFGFGITFVVFV